MKGRKPSAAAKKRGTDRHKQLAKVAPPEHPSLISAAQVDQVPVPAQLPDTGPVRELWRLLLRGVAQTELRESEAHVRLNLRPWKPSSPTWSRPRESRLSSYSRKGLPRTAWGGKSVASAGVLLPRLAREVRLEITEADVDEP